MLCLLEIGKKKFQPALAAEFGSLDTKDNRMLLQYKRETYLKHQPLFKAVFADQGRAGQGTIDVAR